MTKKEFIEELGSHAYTAEVLYRFLFTPIRQFLMKNINKSYGERSVLDLLAGINLKRRPTKDALINICAEFYTNKDFLSAFYNSLSKEDQRIIEQTTWNGAINYKDLNNIYGRKVILAIENEGRFGRELSLFKNKVLEKWVSFMDWETVWNAKDKQTFLIRSNLHLTFPLLLCKAYSQILPKPAGYFFKATTQPGKTIVFNAERTIFREMPLILAYYFQGNIRYSQKGYPNVASSRKMEKQLKLEGFPLSEKNALRGLMIAGLFTDKLKIESPAIPVTTILNDLFSLDFTRNPTAPYLLSHIKGINNFQWSDFNRMITPGLFSLFSEIPEGEWITFDNLKAYCQSHFIDLRVIRSWYDLHRLYPADGFGNTSYGIDRTNIDIFIHQPLLAGHIFLMAAFGLMEIAIDEAAPLEYSYYDGLRAFRLTALGAHILGLKPDYDLPESDNETKLVFDDHQPFIRIEGNLAIGRTMLDNYAEKVSENRYQFSPGKFLADCKTKNDLKNKIAFFEQTVGRELPLFWNEYLAQLHQNSKAVKRVYELESYQLPSENKELHRLVAQDPKLRTIIIKAEQFYVLVEKKNVTKFLIRMKELGYLIG